MELSNAVSSVALNTNQAGPEQWQDFLSERPLYQHLTAFSIKVTDDKWNKLKDRLLGELRYSITNSAAPELLDSLEYTFIEDKETLDGATTEDLRQKFEDLVAATKLVENPHAGSGKENARYSFFVRVDKQAFDSFMDESTPEMDPEEFYNAWDCYFGLVKVHWRTLADYMKEAGKEEAAEESGEPKYDAIEGYTEYNVGWVRIDSSLLIDLEWYLMLCVETNMQFVYARPPEIVDY